MGLIYSSHCPLCNQKRLDDTSGFGMMDMLCRKCEKEMQDHHGDKLAQRDASETQNDSHHKQ